jgi:DNA-binding MarR family transcriptional regulator
MPDTRPLIFQLYTTFQRSGQLVSLALEGSGIRPEDAALYNVLERAGPMTPSELAGRLGVGASTLTYRLKSLEARGIVVRRPNPDDGRSTILELSTSARRHWQKVIPTFAETLRGAERRIALPQDEVAAALEALAQAIDEELSSRSSRRVERGAPGRAAVTARPARPN